MKPARPVLALMACCVIGYSQTRSREKQPPYVPSEPFTGITLGGKIEPGLFEIRSTGVSTAPVREAAQAFLDSLSQEQRQKTLFPVEDREWRMWDNRHFMARQGAGFDEMSEEQRRRAFDLLGAALSAKGLRKTRDIMRLNYTLAELANNFDEYGEWLYWITVMGKPHPSEPWGFQLDGHHVIVNYFVLGDQVVMTPTFMGSEPVRAEAGRYKGTVVMQDEQDKGLALMRSLDATQQAKARVRSDKPGNFNLTEAYKDNVALESVGILAAELTDAQRALLRALIREYVDNMAEGHARLDRWHGRGFRLLLPDPEPGDPDRVRPPEPRRAAPHAGAHPGAHPHRGPDAERQRLRQGPAAPAPRTAPARGGAARRAVGGRPR